MRTCTVTFASNWRSSQRTYAQSQHVVPITDDRGVPRAESGIRDRLVDFGYEEPGVCFIRMHRRKPGQRRQTRPRRRCPRIWTTPSQHVARSRRSNGRRARRLGSRQRGQEKRGGQRRSPEMQVRISVRRSCSRAAKSRYAFHPQASTLSFERSERCQVSRFRDSRCLQPVEPFAAKHASLA